MKRLVQTVAIGAALVAVALGVWRDCGAMLTLQRATLAYLLAYFLAGVMYLGSRAAVDGARDPEPPPPPPEEGTSRGQRKRRQQTATADPAATTDPVVPDPADVGQAPGTVEAR